MNFTPQLSTSGTAASVVGSGEVSGVMLSQIPPSICVLTASFARLAVVVVIHVVTLATTKRASRRIRWTQRLLFGWRIPAFSIHLALFHVVAVFAVFHSIGFSVASTDGLVSFCWKITASAAISLTIPSNLETV